jgi:hypothetical protein
VKELLFLVSIVATYYSPKLGTLAAENRHLRQSYLWITGYYHWGYSRHELVLAALVGAVLGAAHLSYIMKLYGSFQWNWINYAVFSLGWFIITLNIGREFYDRVN